MSRTRLEHVALALACCFATAEAARAGTVQFQLGEQDFADGTTPVLSAAIRAAGAGEQYPFDGSIFGNDLVPSLGAFEYAHRFDLRGATPLSATLTIGLIDVDSPAHAPLDTIALTLDGIEQPAGLFAGVSAPGSPSSAEVVNVPVPVELLADGSLAIGVVAKRAGAGNLGNAIEADFSRLVIETDGRFDPPDPHDAHGDSEGNGDGNDNTDGNGGRDPAEVPVPVVLLPAGLLLAALVAVPKRLLRRWLGM